MTEILERRSVIGSDGISVYTAAIDNEASAALSVGLLANFVGSVLFAVQTLALSIKNAISRGTV